MFAKSITYFGIVFCLFSCSMDSTDEYCNLRVANYTSFVATRIELDTKYGEDRVNEQSVHFPDLQPGEVSEYMLVKVKLGVKSFFDSRTKPEVTVATLAYTTDRAKTKVVANDKFGSGFGVYSPNEDYTISILNSDP